MGDSGMGKSTLLYDLLTQLIIEDAGFALLDPHGELYGQLLSFLAYIDYRQDEVSLIDATRRDVTATVNPFTSAPDQDTIETKAQILADLTVQVWGKDSQAVRADKILYILYIALLEQGRPLADILDVLANPGDIRDAFARSEWAKIKPAYLDSVMTRLQPLTHERLLALTNPDQALDFNDLLNGKILLANLSRSDLMGQSECQTLSAFLVAEIWSAAFRRRQRYPAFYLVIDEFAILATPELASVLTQAQKFGLHLIFLHHDTRLLPTYIRSAIDNVSSFIVFLAKGKVMVNGWESGTQVAWFDPEPVPEVDDEYVEEYRAAVTIPPVRKALAAPSTPLLQLPAPVLQLPKGPGKGGPHHVHLQGLVKDIGERHGFKAEIEKAIEGAQIDVSLERKGVRIAVEVCDASSTEKEVNSAVKSLVAGYDHAVVIVAKSQRLAALNERLNPLGARAFDPPGFFAFLASLDKKKGARANSEQACEELGIDRSTLYRKCRSGELDHYKVGSKYQFDWKVLAEYGRKDAPKVQVRLKPLKIDKTRPAKKEKQDEFFRKELFGE